MATVNVPEGFAAVVVLIPKGGDGDAKAMFVGHEEGMESALAADAIPVLVDYMADDIEALEAELADAEAGDDPPAGGEEEEPEEPS